MKIIHDHLWGDIELSDIAIQIIDTPHFQRLHYIKQTGFAYKVFPNATTTRFQHSIGVYHVVKLFLNTLLQSQKESLSLPDRTVELLCIAGLLHDIGHGPYSHNFDLLLESWHLENEWVNHEYRSIDMIDHLIHENKINISKEEIEFINDRILGIYSQHWYDILIHNTVFGLDCDKIDYLLRDSLNFGLQIKFDPFRIFKNTRVIENELCFCDRIQDELMTCFLIRNKMNHTIYRHPKILDIEQCYIEQLNNKISLCQKWLDICKSKNIDEFLKLNDYNVLAELPLWSQIECRKIKSNKNLHQPYTDKEWIKLKKAKFYSKKDVNQSFLIQDWNISSCYTFSSVDNSFT